MGKSRNLWIIIRWWGCVFSYVCICKAGEEEDTTALCLRCLQGLEEKHRSSISSRPLRLEESSGTARKSHTESHLCSYVASCISLLVANPTYVHTPAVYNDLEPPPHHNHPHLCTSVACCLCRLFAAAAVGRRGTHIIGVARTNGLTFPTLTLLLQRTSKSGPIPPPPPPPPPKSLPLPPPLPPRCTAAAALQVPAPAHDFSFHPMAHLMAHVHAHVRACQIAANRRSRSSHATYVRSMHRPMRMPAPAS